MLIISQHYRKHKESTLPTREQQDLTWSAYSVKVGIDVFHYLFVAMVMHHYFEQSFCYYVQIISWALDLLGRESTCLCRGGCCAAKGVLREYLLKPWMDEYGCWKSQQNYSVWSGVSLSWSGDWQVGPATNVHSKGALGPLQDGTLIMVRLISYHTWYLFWWRLTTSNADRQSGALEGYRWLNELTISKQRFLAVLLFSFLA